MMEGTSGKLSGEVSVEKYAEIWLETFLPDIVREKGKSVPRYASFSRNFL